MSRRAVRAAAGALSVPQPARWRAWRVSGYHRHASTPAGRQTIHVDGGAFTAR